MNPGDQFYLHMLKQISEVAFPAVKAVAAAPLKTQENDLALLREQVIHHYSRQEYFRQAHNEVVAQLTALAPSLPDWIFESANLTENTFPSGPQLDNVSVDSVPDDEVDEPDELGPDMLQFMLQTIRHREERDKKKQSANEDELALPPLKKCAHPLKIPPAGDHTLNEIFRIETFIQDYYDYASECRDAPLWPVIPFRKCT
ncbi:unnamed protein product [Schistocephalus solidus]|uniref:Gem-associated protein 2 n=1 Tax=Schistocephalus solidus TaxID=70667 RepID=A0A183T3S9_SCHSO|nr:unnamed protein product [Schistocephalus solidus]